MKKFFVLISLLVVGSFYALSVHAVTIPVSGNLPGTQGNCTDPSSNQCNPAGFINDFYTFALLVGGILAFGAVVYGGVLYMTSAGNPSGQHEGREWIESALLGLLLLAGAWLILNIVNPNLTKLQLPSLPSTPAGQTQQANG